MKGKSAAMECLEAVVDANNLPWQINVKWSDDAPTILGDVPDRPPRKMSLAAIHNRFRVLRITNQGVEDLDKSVKHFKHLEKLILTANNIQKVDSRFLPPNLEFLELCANAITSLEPICLRPPPLTHLGVGYNRVRSLEGCVSASLWPRLLSLDLSFNDLDDLHDVVGKMKLLPSLRSLLLLGNPLSLTPGYRGYIVDYLKDLLIFDDVFISADERHDFDGLANQRARVKNAARVTLEALSVRGISAPTDEKPSDDNTEFPIVSRKFAVYFLLPLDKAEVAKERAKAAAAAEAAAAAAAEKECDERFEEERRRQQQQQQQQQQHPVVPVILEGHGSLTGSVTYPGEDAAAAATATAAEEEEEGELAKPKKKIPLPKVEEEMIVVPEGDDGDYAVKPTKTNPVAWAEEIDLNWKKEVDRGDLLVTRNFFKKGMDVHVVEEKILAYPSDQIEGLESRGASPGDGARSAASKAAGGAKSRAEAAKGGGKDAKAGGTAAGGSGAERKKKKGDAEVDLFYMPPEVTLLAKFRVDMIEFLDGETELDFLFCREGDKESIVKTAKRDRDAKEEKDKEAKGKAGAGGGGGGGGGKAGGGGGGATAGGKKEDDAGKKGGKAEELKPPASKQTSERGGGKSSAGATTKSSKGGGEKGGGGGAGGGAGGGGGGGKGERVGTGEHIAEEVALPPPLECHFRVHLAKWRKAQDATPAAVEKKKSTTSKAGRTSGRKSAKAE